MLAVTVTHMAGPYVVIQNRVIQRCLICGEKLADMLIRKASVPSLKNLPGVWEPYCYVRFNTDDTVVSKTIIDIGVEMEFPDDWCLSLVEM